MCWRFFFSISFFSNCCLFLALLAAFMSCCFNPFVDVSVCCVTILCGCCACCTIRRGLKCFDDTTRVYLKTRAQEHWVTWVFASAFLVPRSPLKAATQTHFHLFGDIKCSCPQRNDSNALSEPKNFCLSPRQKNYFLHQVAGFNAEVNGWNAKTWVMWEARLGDLMTWDTVKLYIKKTVIIPAQKNTTVCTASCIAAERRKIYLCCNSCVFPHSSSINITFYG